MRNRRYRAWEARLSVSLLDLVDHGIGRKIDHADQPAAVFTVRRFRCGRSGGLAIRRDGKAGGTEVLAVDVGDDRIQCAVVGWVSDLGQIEHGVGARPTMLKTCRLRRRGFSGMVRDVRTALVG